MSTYNYKVKAPYIKILDTYGFYLFSDTDVDDAEFIWARQLTFTPDSSIATWLKKTLEKIFNKGKCSHYVRKDFWTTGYKFNKQGELIINEKFVQDLKGELCVSINGNDKGILFINMDGMNFSDTKTLDECAYDIVQELLQNKVIYRVKEKEQEQDEVHN